MKKWQDERNQRLLDHYELQFDTLVFFGSSEEEANEKLDDEALTNRIIFELIVPAGFFTIYIWSICFLLVYWPYLVRIKVFL